MAVRPRAEPEDELWSLRTGWGTEVNAQILPIGRVDRKNLPATPAADILNLDGSGNR